MQTDQVMALRFERMRNRIADRRRLPRLGDHELLEQLPRYDGPGFEWATVAHRFSDEFAASLWRHPRTTWGEGPWQKEPDRVAWSDRRGRPLLMGRNPIGSWCGYVGLPPGHPWHGIGYDTIERASSSVEAHGGLTYSGLDYGLICGDYAGPAYWWIGFDCSHFRDLSPVLEALSSRREHAFRSAYSFGEYRTAEWVRFEVEQLSGQLDSVALGKVIGWLPLSAREAIFEWPIEAESAARREWQATRHAFREIYLEQGKAA